ncbi:hypothetical protein PQX77_002054, partial [Marasmius sp. AFHP31]
MDAGEQDLLPGLMKLSMRLSQRELLRIAAGTYTTLFLVNPSSAVSTSPIEKKDGEDDDDDKHTNLPRCPVELAGMTDAWVKCNKDSEDPLECDK